MNKQKNLAKTKFIMNFFRKIFLFFIMASIIGSFQLNLATAPAFGNFKYNFSQTAIKSEIDDNFYDKASTDTKQVYLGGFAVGINLKTKGVVLIGRIDIFTESGCVNTLKNSSAMNGDTILTIAGEEILSSKDISTVVNKPENAGKILKMMIKRNGKELETNIEPALDIVTNSYKAGLLVREENSGVGTVTFIKKNGRFALLGHPVYDGDTKKIMDITGGSIQNIIINNITKGKRGDAGQISGQIDPQPIGTIDKNTNFGVYGYTNNKFTETLIDVMPRDKVKMGKAYIYSTIDGTTPEKFEIEIVKTTKQKTEKEKGMVIKVTDKRLKNKVGGIVQGMSGSPIVQNGKLVGAVTHVFVNNSALGYGMYADFMLNK